jgi:hypothetical protein
MFGLRNDSVHYDEVFGAPVEHPVMGHVAPERVEYTCENATRAVGVMLEVFTTCDLGHLKSTAHRAHVDWCIRWRQNITKLGFERDNLTDARREKSSGV